MKKLEMIFGVLRVPADIAAVTLALVISYRLREANVDLVPGVQLLEAPSTLPAFSHYLTEFIVPGIAVFLFAAALHELYALKSTESRWREFGQVCMAVATWLVVVTVWYFFVRKELFYSRILLLHATALLALCVFAFRTALTGAERSLLRRGFGVRRVATVGREPAPNVLAEVEAEPSYRYAGHAVSFAALSALHAAEPLDLVLETAPNPQSEDTLQLIDFCRSRHVEYAFLPPVFADSPHLLAVDRLGLLPLVRFQPTPLDGWGRVWKAIGDRVLALLLTIALSPLLLLIAIGVLIDGGWPIFYVSRRVGQHGRRLIPVLKFRTMVKNADQLKSELLAQNERRDGPLFKMKHDPRITRFGRFLRRWSLDELPQFLNVLAGQLSLVGPRPHLPDEVKLYADRERRVFAVKPGVTGLAQVSGRSDLTFADEVRLDLQYIEEWRGRLDLWILWRTLVVVLARKGAN
ncbi:MAG: sugar transferase [Candidatus Peribacteraceae bacterium]|nr:sugar transferase [Candidatus Peribacteraceae bacterium]